MTAIATALTRMFGVRVPLFNAPMTPQAGGALARAVADAGAIGMLGFDEDETAEQIGEQLAVLQAGTAPAFGIGLVAWVLERRPDLLDLAIAAKPRFASISFGDPSPYVERLHAAGILVGSQVQDRRRARAALDAGVDVLVAQGTEAGGHTGAVGTLPLLQLVLEMTDKPVVAAGGIVTGRGFAAALAAGAAGVWVGTPFLLARESRTTPQAQAVIAASDETQTILTSVYDRVQRKGWTPEFRGRALRNPFVDRWHGHEDELMATPAAIDAFERAKGSRDYTRANIYVGQSVGAIAEIVAAADIVRNLESGAIAALRDAARLID
ncbi:MAG TPA: nitronate monooxygenase [Candidatus Baltobacteraceae bacterium]